MIGMWQKNQGNFELSGTRINRVRIKRARPVCIVSIITNKRNVCLHIPELFLSIRVFPSVTTQIAQPVFGRLYFPHVLTCGNLTFEEIHKHLEICV